jgi:hypothetical protein
MSDAASKTWAQNGRKTTVKWAQIEGCRVSKGSRISVNFAESWSGRWESNPRPRLGNPATTFLQFSGARAA